LECSRVEYELAAATAGFSNKERVLHEDNAPTIDFNAGAVAGMGSDSKIAGQPRPGGHSDLAVAAYVHAEIGAGKTGGPVCGVTPDAATGRPRGRNLREGQSSGE
jgi:hypothetical protein